MQGPAKPLRTTFVSHASMRPPSSLTSSLSEARPLPAARLSQSTATHSTATHKPSPELPAAAHASRSSPQQQAPAALALPGDEACLPRLEPLLPDSWNVGSALPPKPPAASQKHQGPVHRVHSKARPALSSFNHQLPSCDGHRPAVPPEKLPSAAFAPPEPQSCSPPASARLAPPSALSPPPQAQKHAIPAASRPPVAPSQLPARKAAATAACMRKDAPRQLAAHGSPAAAAATAVPTSARPLRGRGSQTGHLPSDAPDMCASLSGAESEGSGRDSGNRSDSSKSSSSSSSGGRSDEDWQAAIDAQQEEVVQPQQTRVKAMAPDKDKRQPGSAPTRKRRSGVYATPLSGDEMSQITRHWWDSCHGGP